MTVDDPPMPPGANIPPRTPRINLGAPPDADVDPSPADPGTSRAAPVHAPQIVPAPARRAPRRIPFLGPMRVRKKLILLHTCFSAALATVLLLVIRPAVSQLINQAELHEAEVAMLLLTQDPVKTVARRIEGVEFARGSVRDLNIDPPAAAEASRKPDENIIASAGPDQAPRIIRWSPELGEFLSVTVRSPAARSAVIEVYGLLIAAVLAVYTLIALTLDIFVLPRQVYRPIGLVLDADAALREGRRDEEIIPDGDIPADELGEIMRSRNESVAQLRRQERALSDAFDRLEAVAMELKRKNHLLETARRNLADQDRLASLGMMSAGIAHELNTPLAVLKGQVEAICEAPERGLAKDQAERMLRVVRRLERLSESLLDFARARPPARERVPLRAVVDEAWTLVSLDRGRGFGMINAVPDDAEVTGDGDRLHQVFVNLLRNAVDAMDSAAAGGSITVSAEESEREGDRWISVSVADEGPGIDPDVLPRLFEPFASTRLDSHGTGLGLAVSDGIIREHGGVILARNGYPRAGARRPSAVFEVMLPVRGPRDDAPKPGAPMSQTPTLKPMHPPRKEPA